MKNFNVIKWFYLSTGMTTKEIAKAFKVSKYVVENWIYGKTKFDGIKYKKVNELLHDYFEELYVTEEEGVINPIVATRDMAIVTQQEFATLFGVTQQTISLWELGESLGWMDYDNLPFDVEDYL